MSFDLMTVLNIRAHHRGALRVASVALLVLAGCRTTGSGEKPRIHRKAHGDYIRGVRCLFDQKPWISADAAGDRDPEGIRYRVFLDNGSARGVLHEGKFHIEMYLISRNENGELERTLVSDWHYPTSQFPRVSARILGIGYHVRLRWAKKETAGNEVELVTAFEDPDGTISRGATKRLRVPKYSS